jgi:hypothetical protein
MQHPRAVPRRKTSRVGSGLPGQQCPPPCISQANGHGSCKQPYSESFNHGLFLPMRAHGKLRTLSSGQNRVTGAGALVYALDQGKRGGLRFAKLPQVLHQD